MSADKSCGLVPQTGCGRCWKALEVLEQELEGENRLQAAVHVLKGCRLYRAELPSGSIDAAEIAVAEKERVKKRQQRAFFANIPSI